MLSACAPSVSPPQLRLPPLPGDLATACRDPGVRAGKTMLGELARNRLALAECSKKHRDTVTFYGTLSK